MIGMFIGCILARLPEEITAGRVVFAGGHWYHGKAQISCGENMSDINFGYKISFQRPFSPAISAQDDYAIICQFESDRRRIINAAAITPPIAKKTDVSP